MLYSQSESRQLFDDYSYYREQTVYFKKLKRAKPYLRPLKPTADKLQALTRMASWCKKLDIPPRQWLFSLFEVRRWMAAPQLDEAYLQSKKHLKRFPGKIDFEFYTNYIRNQENLKKLNNPQLQFDPNKDISQAAELAKRYYLANGGPTVCQQNMHSETFGYHPHSFICQTCPGNIECLTKLRSEVLYDPIALRLGHIDQVTARNTAIRRLNYGN